MKLTYDELEFLSAWAREEGELACYQLPSHRLQLAHGVSAAQLLVFIKAWTEVEGRKDLDILGVAANPQPRWPWATTEDFGARFAEASRWRTHRKGVKNASEPGGKGNFPGESCRLANG
ncbi:MAG: hypothetical protein HYS12_00230 [Planctomycetes bacterium]|nr:hypothetical protein [Planctomycetota bacterium]